MDEFYDCDPPVGKPDPLRNSTVAGVGGLLFFGSPLLAYATDNPWWFLGWVVLIILGLA